MMTYPRTLTFQVRRSRISGWLRRGLDLLFPPRCVACSQMGTWFCGECLDSVQPIGRPICPHCGRPTTIEMLCSQCRNTPLRIDGIRSVAIHDGALRKAIHHFKYHRQRELVDALGPMLLDYWKRATIPADLVVPVPLHKSRQAERGFNQAGLLAEYLTSHSGEPLDDVHLIRTRPTIPQVGLDANERAENVKDAFAWVGEDLTGHQVLLVDDVFTTGATLQACAQTLQKAGADSVWALTLARPQ